MADVRVVGGVLAIRLKAAITAHETRLEEEEQKRVKLENLLR